MTIKSYIQCDLNLLSARFHIHSSINRVKVQKVVGSKQPPSEFVAIPTPTGRQIPDFPSTSSMRVPQEDQLFPNTSPTQTLTPLTSVHVCQTPLLCSFHHRRLTTPRQRSVKKSYHRHPSTAISGPPSRTGAPQSVFLRPLLR